jgi:hypothetical protein
VIEKLVSSVIEQSQLELELGTDQPNPRQRVTLLLQQCRNALKSRIDFAPREFQAFMVTTGYDGIGGEDNCLEQHL